MMDVVVLAAGRGRRWGGPKALAVHAGQTFLCRVLETVSGFAERVVVVVPPGVSTPWIPGWDGTLWVENPQPKEGMFSSVRLGLTKLGPLRQTLIFPVDHPLVRRETIEALGAGGQSVPDASQRVVVPTLGGRGGHPVLIGRRAALALLEVGPESTLRDAMRGVGTEPVRIPVEDPGIIRNINYKKDLGQS